MWGYDLFTNTVVEAKVDWVPQDNENENNMK